jgi:hypothetical protein
MPDERIKITFGKIWYFWIDFSNYNFYFWKNVVILGRFFQNSDTISRRDGIAPLFRHSILKKTIHGTSHHRSNQRKRKIR